jgi:hypothetical protein
MTVITNRKRARNRVLRVAITALLATLATALAADAQGRRKPDLVERQIGNPPAQLSPGVSFKVADVAGNRGTASAGASLTRYYLVSGGTVLPAGARRVPALKRHHRSRGGVRLSIPPVAPAGRYSLLACVDANRHIAETNERNNCRASRRRVAVPGPGGVVPPSSPPAPVTSVDSDGDGFPDSVDCAPRDPSVHPGATDVPDAGLVDSNCDGIDGDPADAVFVSPAGSDVNPGTMSRPFLTLGAAVSAAALRSRDVYAAIGTYAEELRVAPGVSVYGGYGSSWQRTLLMVTRITGSVTGSGDTEGAVAFNVVTPTTLQLLTISPAMPTLAGASSYGLRGLHSPGLRLERVTVVAAQGVAGAAGAAGAPGAPGGNGGGTFPNRGGTSPIGHPGGGGGAGNGPFGSSSSAADGESGLLTNPDQFGGMGGPGGSAGESGNTHTAGGRGSDGDSGVFRGDGVFGGGPGNVIAGSGLWHGRAGQNGSAGSDGHGGGGGGGGGDDPCISCEGGGGFGGGGGGGGQGGGGGNGGSPGGASFAIFLVDSTGAVVRDSTLTAQNGGRGGAGGGGAFGGQGGAPAPGEPADGNDASDGGDGGRGGSGGRGGDGGGGAGGPSAAVVGLTPSATPGTVLTHALGGAGGAGGVGAGNGGGRGADAPSADFLSDGP